MSGRDELFKQQFLRDAEQASSFAARLRARAQLFDRGWGDDPFAPESIDPELDRAAAQGTAAALADVGRVLLLAEQFELLEAWLARLPAPEREDREALAVVGAMVAVRQGDNAAAAAALHGVPLEEAVALHGLALLQVGQPEDAAARLEVLLAADALDEQGEVRPRYLPEAMPALSLFLTACATSADRALARGDRAAAATYALAAGDALRRYAQAEAPEGPSREDIAALLDRVAPQ